MKKIFFITIFFISTLFAEKIQIRVVASDDKLARYIAIQEAASKVGQEVIVVSGEQIHPSKIEKISMMSKSLLGRDTYEYIFLVHTKDDSMKYSIFWTIDKILPLFNFLIFPGLLFSIFFAFIISFIDRKLTARIQWRQGPPLWQGMYDFIKLLGKEVLIPSRAQKTIFVLSPIVGFSITVLVSTMLWLYFFVPKYSFSGDIIVVLYLMTVPAVVYMLGASASGNVVAGLGVSREMKLMLSYELPLITAILVPVIKSSSIKILDIMQNSSQPIIFSLSGFLAFLVAVISFQAKIGLVPFDASEAEQEIAGGITIEYSGILLGLIKLAKQILYSIVPLFIIMTFFPGGGLLVVIKYFIVLLLFVLIRNTNPRLKIGQSINFFWKIIFPISLIAIILAVSGK